MGRPGLASRPRSTNNSPKRTAAPISPVASPTRRKIVCAPALDAPVQPSTLQENSDDRDSGSGGDKPSQTYGDPGVGGLSQLSDLADGALGSEPGHLQSQGASRAVSQYKASPSVQMAISSQSQERLEVDIGNDLPSQAEANIPTPRIPDGPPALQEPHGPPQHPELALDRVLPQHDEKGLRVRALVDSIKNPSGLAQPMVPQHYSHLQGGARGSGSADEEALHPKSRAARRGPMDEMRQLVRILVKIIPQSMSLVTSGPEGGGNNRISEEQIKSYLMHTLGEAPYPQWGVPQGWGQYLAELLTWATGRHISKSEAMRCARREPGRSWQSIPSELARIGVFPEKWSLPLSAAGQRSLWDQNSGAVASAAAEAGPVHMHAVKRQIPELSNAPQQAQPKRRAVQSAPEAKVPSAKDRAAAQLEGCSELELWEATTHFLRMAQRRAGTTTLQEQHLLAAAQQEHRRALEVSVPSSQLPIAHLEAGPPASMQGLAAASAPPSGLPVSLPQGLSLLQGLTPEQLQQYSFQTGKPITTRTEGGMQYAELRLGPDGDAAQTALHLQALMKMRESMHTASLASIPMQQVTSLNGSLGTIPHTDSQSHISPPPHLPETEASQGPGGPDGAAASPTGKLGDGNSRRLSFDNHPGLQVGGEPVAAAQPSAAAAAAAPPDGSQVLSTETNILLHNKKALLQHPIGRLADAPASSGGFMPLSQDSRAGSVAQQLPHAAGGGGGRPSPLGAHA